MGDYLEQLKECLEGLKQEVDEAGHRLENRTFDEYDTSRSDYHDYMYWSGAMVMCEAAIIEYQEHLSTTAPCQKGFCLPIAKGCRDESSD